MAELLYAHLAAFFYSEVWAVQLPKLEAMRAALEFLRTGNRYSAEEVASIMAARPAQAQPLPSVAVLPLYGVISHRANLVNGASGGTSVQQFTKVFRQAAADPSIGAIVLDVDSPGGSVSGVPELAAEIRAARAQKPILAVANSLAASAAYWLGAQASESYVIPSGEVGSIGVYAMHQDESGFYDKAGVKTTLVSAGKYKTENSPFSPLSEDGRDYLQGRVDDYYSMFVRDVAEGRGVEADLVRSGWGEGRVLGAQQAKAEGMVDDIATLDEVIQRAGRLVRDNARLKGELELRQYQAKRFGS